MDILCEKAMKNDNEPFSLKLHYLAYILRHCSEAESIESVIKWYVFTMLLRFLI